MEEHFVYILYSSKIDKYYVGYSEKPDKRLEFHNSSFNKIWTKSGQPWVKKCTIQFETKAKAMSVERRIKDLKSRPVIEDIIKNGWKE
ncbi:MAG: GIY-YIG nuclease family protein [Bacteroidota bacterium]